MIHTHRYATGLVLDCSAIPNDPLTCVQRDSVETWPKEWADPLTQNQMNNTSFTLPKLPPQKPGYESSAPLVNTLRSPTSSSLAFGGRHGRFCFLCVETFTKPSQSLLKPVSTREQISTPTSWYLQCFVQPQAS